mmetsp:Transcript_18425/g.28843  ORF Transcript_18425/g.28843 Transcript_18425/m.28843 type:complete len:264 (-) Transcript_18425:14-805(-)
MRATVKTLVAACEIVPPYTVKDGQRYVTVRRLTHRIRNQSIMLVPIPHLASKNFYEEWAYQPYIKHHTLAIATDISMPAHVLFFPLFNGTQSDIRIYHPRYIPGPLELDMTRKDYEKRLIQLNDSMLKLNFVPAQYRDRHCAPIVKKHLRNLLGNRYIHHAVSLDASEKESFVVFFNQHWVPHAVKQLQHDFGFEISESIEVPVGDDKALDRVEQLCHRANLTLLGYLGLQLVVLVVYGFFHFIEVGRKEWEAQQKALEGGAK